MSEPRSSLLHPKLGVFDSTRRSCEQLIQARGDPPTASVSHDSIASLHLLRIRTVHTAAASGIWLHVEKALP